MSLYRKYRPQTFEDVVGQEHIAQTLRNALGADPLRVAHAYLFCGPRGTGKTTTARLLAKCLNCSQGPTATPCNECDFCMRVRDNQPVMDLIEIDAASNTGVDNVRETIIEKVNVAPAQGRYRVYIIDEVHMLSVSSFNALLKTLEEPPAHAIFVLATTDAHKVPPTITSRCQRFDFRRVGPRDIVSRLQHVAAEENFGLSEDAARLISHTADGALRDALTLLEQVSAFSAEEISEADVRLVLGTVSQELLREIMAAIAGHDAVSVLRQIDRATEEGASFSQLTRDLTNYCRDLLLLTLGFEGSGMLSESEKKRRHQHAQQMGRGRLMNCVEALRAAEKEMRQSTDHRLLLELTLVRAASAEGDLSAPSVTIPTVVTPIVEPAPRPLPQPPTSHAPVWRQPQVQAPPPTVVPPVQPMPERAASNGAAHPRDDAAILSNGAAPAEATPLLAATPPVAETSVPAESAPVEPVAPDQPASKDAAPLETEDGATVAPSSKKKGRRIHNLEEFIELWPAVLARVKRKIGVSAVAYLHDAWPVSIDDNDAVLEFKKEFHYAKACDAAKRLPFEQVLNECMATPHRLKFQLAKPPSNPAPVRAPEPVRSDEDEEDDVLKLAQDMFGAEVVGRSGGG